MDLSLVPTADLLEALKARFDHVVFTGLRVAGQGRADEEHQLWNGHALTCVGLGMGMIRQIQDFERESEDT